MRYKLAMYDWNGTVADDPRICHECVQQIFRTFGPELPLPSFDEWQTHHTNSTFLNFYYERGIPRSVTIHSTRDIWANHYDKLANSNGTLVREGTEPLLAFCRSQGLSNVMVSSSIDNVEQHLVKAEVRDLFDDLRLQVPHKRTAFIDVLRSLEVGSEESFYVDDSPDGIGQAKELGITTFGLTTGCSAPSRIIEAGPDYVVRSFFEVLQVLQKL